MSHSANHFATLLWIHAAVLSVHVALPVACGSAPQVIWPRAPAVDMDQGTVGVVVRFDERLAKFEVECCSSNHVCSGTKIWKGGGGVDAGIRS